MCDSYKQSKGEWIIIRKIFYSFLILCLLSACSHEGVTEIDITEDDEVLSIQDVKIPSAIFTSHKQNSVIDEEEMRLSIKTYLDSHDELLNASEPFQDAIDEEKELTKEEREKLDKINKLIKENDENFSDYILNNTLPEGYLEESKRISRYIVTVNETLDELNKMLDDNGDFPEINVGAIIKNSKIANGKEQKKIEDFLDEKKIDTKAFGRE
ncbi:NDxxF motif lipoprotein [uncultured Rummeliibacillus sp.]|uniref:NDxxF motif lipoprotein n=1 Tax=uncultured Rummeliibacillus sp. TaxID=762292 RepID=UPI00260AF684|nr:NDxxF motif lipoprotein [uncultured Rummeliibacillus sp.]